MTSITDFGTSKATGKNSPMSTFKKKQKSPSAELGKFSHRKFLYFRRLARIDGFPLV